MAKRRQRTKTQQSPGWVWMLAGLAIGLAVAVYVHVGNQQRVAGPPSKKQQTEKPQTTAKEEPETEGTRYDFYEMLRDFEVVIPEREPEFRRGVGAEPVTRAGEYVLQAGSFQNYSDADRRKAELALLGLESEIQRVSVDGKVWHRVRVGPVRDLAKVNLTKNRLEEAGVEFIIIRVGG